MSQIEDNTDKKTSRKYFPQLTGLRAIAAFLVYFHHFTPWGPTSRFTAEWHIGVNVFFVLSGFLIAHRYANTFVWQWGSIKHYLVNRFARIYPMYLILTLITFAYDAWQSEQFTPLSRMVLIANLTMLRGFADQLKFTGISQGWSLTVEECFYLSAPLVFLLYRRKGWFWSLGLGLLSFGLLLTFFLKELGLARYGLFGSYQFTLLYTFPGRFFEFFVGMRLARHLHNREEESSTIRHWTWYGLLGTSLCVGLLALFSSESHGSGIFTHQGLVISLFVLPLCISAMLYGLIEEETWLSQLLSSGLFLKLGKASYVFYLIHMGVFQILTEKLVSALGLPYFLPQLTIFLTLNALAFLMFRFVEDPLNSWIRSHFRQPKAVAPSSGLNSQNESPE